MDQVSRELSVHGLPHSDRLIGIPARQHRAALFDAICLELGSAATRSASIHLRFRPRRWVAWGRPIRIMPNENRCKTVEQGSVCPNEEQIPASAIPWRTFWGRVALFAEHDDDPQRCASALAANPPHPPPCVSSGRLGRQSRKEVRYAAARNLRGGIPWRRFSFGRSQLPRAPTC
jgi:hypothetical protein